MKRRELFQSAAYAIALGLPGFTVLTEAKEPTTFLIPHHADTYWRQIAAAEGFAYREHKRLLAEGWQWDGMDGYSK